MRIILICIFLLPSVFLSEFACAYELKDDFEDEPCNSQPSHWLEQRSSTSPNWSVQCVESNKLYGPSTASKKLQYTYLHLFERNPTFSGRFFVDEKNRGHFGFLLRLNSDHSYVKIIYDFGTTLYMIVEQEEKNRPKHTHKRETAWLADGWHDFRVVAKDSLIQLYVDEKLVIESEGILHQTFGRIGFEERNCKVFFDDISYSGEYGRPNDGVLEYEINSFDSLGINIAQHLTIQTKDDGNLIGMAATADHRVIKKNQRFPLYLITSNDMGNSWVKLEQNEHQLVIADGDTIIHSCPQLLKLNSGKYLSKGLTKDGKAQFVLSENEGLTWTKAGTISNINRNGLMPDKIIQTSSGEIYASVQRNLYMSDDEGHNWNHIMPFPLYEAKTRYVSVQEMQPVELPGGYLRIYARDGRPGSNTLASSISKPGARWNDFKNKRNNTPFVAPKCAFNIEKDQYNPGHYYMFWTYNDRNDEPSVNNLPRTRLALAVSYDNTKTWQYVMDVEEWGYPSTGFAEKDNRYANHALHVSKDYIFMTLKRRNPIGHKKHDDCSIWFTRVDKSKIQVYGGFPGTHY